MSYYYLLGYRSFKSETDIKKTVADFYNEYIKTSSLEVANSDKLDESILNSVETSKKVKFNDVNTLKIFQTKRQQTWIASVSGYFFCLLDDIEVDIQKNSELIRWFSKVSEISNKIEFHSSSKSPEKVGIINFGTNHKNWFYSKALLNDETMAKAYVDNIVLSGATVG